jgi:trehalose 6-phosphate phosphatase
MENNITDLTQKAATAKTLRLFLDYDGTLADFAPSPDTILPDTEVISLLKRLVAADGVLPAVISGRRLAHIKKLLPIPGLLMGGTYGIEMQLPDGSEQSILSFESVRPLLEKLLPRWQSIIEGRPGFYLEDKGWTLAIHGRFADPHESRLLMAEAYAEAQNLLPGDTFHLMSGERFLELAPKAANKRTAISRVIEALTPPEALCISIGDDDKDEEAFSALPPKRGFAVRVSSQPVETQAQYRLPGPAQVRSWLKQLLSARDA